MCAMDSYNSDWLLSKRFETVGQWRLSSKSNQFEFQCNATEVAGIYAFSVENYVHYIGSSNNLQRRLTSYKRRVHRLDERTLASQSAALVDEQAEKKEIVERLVRREIRGTLRAGKEIQIDIFAPSRSLRFANNFDGMTLDLVAGLEMGLIQQLSPPWNIRGREGELLAADG
jgi:hypothetical protein